MDEPTSSSSHSFIVKTDVVGSEFVSVAVLHALCERLASRS